jgi:Sec-independent protein translocase protein TatA
MGHFAQSTIYANRARLGGIIFLVISLGFFLIGSLVVSDITLAIVALTIVQILSLSVFVKFKTKIAISHEAQKTTYARVLSSRPLLLFLIPWFVFNIVNYMTIPVVGRLSQEYEIMTSLNLLENIIIAIVALVTGFLADSIGRKRLAIFGFASFGVGYAVLGLIQDSARWPIHIVADGLAWGTLYVLFLFTLWGDLAQGQRGEKFYVMGALPFLFSNFMTPFLATLTANIHPETLFSFASFFLFLAVLPLVYAPETLPEKVMKARDLQSYVEKAKQKAEKESEKIQKRDSDQAEEETDKEKEKPEESSEDEEARKLAEKYY